MTITAAKLGSAPITLDWSNLVPVSGKDSGYPTTAWSEAWEKLKTQFERNEVGFFRSPANNELSAAKESEALAEEVLRSGGFRDALFLGIGGSSLGPISLLATLQERCKTGLRFHFLENPDPVQWKLTLQGLKPETTLVCIVTKSGTTFETMAQFLIALDWLGKSRWKSHVVAITDPTKGDLRAFATQEGLRTLPIAPSIGGRFSIFSPVGLFPAALAGLSVSDFLQGAQSVHDYVQKVPAEKNSLFILGNELLRQAARRPIHVCMPYSSQLKKVGDWFVQLWAESLGKDGKGFTPMGAVGATDQHSILQLLRDGPDDKVTWFMTIDRVDDPVKIPKLPITAGLQQYPSFTLLGGHTLHHLLMTEYQATARVLSKKGRPNLTFRIDQLDERSMGALYFAFSTLTAFTGTLWGVNPFDQPGVEEGKVYIREALSGEASRRLDAEDDDNSPVARLRRGRE